MLQYFPLDLIYNIVDEIQSSKDARSLSQTSMQLQSTLQSTLDHQSRINRESLKLPWPLLHGAVHTKSRRLALRTRSRPGLREHGHPIWSRNTRAAHRDGTSLRCL